MARQVRPAPPLYRRPAAERFAAARPLVGAVVRAVVHPGRYADQAETHVAELVSAPRGPGFTTTGLIVLRPLFPSSSAGTPDGTYRRRRGGDLDYAITLAEVASLELVAR